MRLISHQKKVLGLFRAVNVAQWRFVLQFHKKKVYKRCFFNTKYLPKHQGVSCCDLLHLQYLSDVSLYPSLQPTNSSSWFHYPGTEKKKEIQKESKVPALSLKLMQLHHLNNSQARKDAAQFLTWPFNIFSMRKECKLFPTTWLYILNVWNGVFTDEDNVSEVKTSTHK